MLAADLKIEISKLKKKRILPDTVGKMFVFGVMKDHRIIYNSKTLLDYMQNKRIWSFLRFQLV